MELHSVCLESEVMECTGSNITDRREPKDIVVSSLIVSERNQKRKSPSFP
jgi:hypothetical protein